MTVRPEFVPRDPLAITAEMVTAWEQLTGKTLYPAQVERLLIDLAAYREVLTRQSIQESAEQNLLSFARGEALDALAELLGAARLAAEPAGATLRFTLSTPLEADRLVPAGTVVRAGDGREFATQLDARIAATSLSADVSARAVIAGPDGNGYGPGELREIAGNTDPMLTVANLGVSYGGRSAEGDEPFRTRLRLAASRASCGTLEAYRFHALSVSSRIVDVSIAVPEAGRVRIHLLTDEGAPDAPLLAAATLALNDHTRRPLTDWVEVLAPVPVSLALDVDLILSRRASSTAPDQVARRLDAFAATRRLRLAQGLRREHVAAEVMAVTGVLGLTSLAPAWDLTLTAGQWLEILPRVTVSEVRDD